MMNTKSMMSGFLGLVLAVGAHAAMAASADLGLTITGTYTPYCCNSKTTNTADFTVTVTNNGPDTATNVTIHNIGTSSRGQFINIQSSVSLGTIASGASVSTTLYGVGVVGANFQSYVLTVQSTASSDATDPNASNNTASATVTVRR